ncbi:MAG: DEAD/DEAH box helicase [Pedobacter sp.]
MAPISRTTLSLCLQKANVRVDTGRAISVQSLTPILDELREKQLVFEMQGGFLCQSVLQHPLIRQIEQDGNLERFTLGVKPHIRCNYYKSPAQCLQDLRLAVYLRDEAEVQRILDYYYKYYHYELKNSDPFSTIFPEPLDSAFIITLPAPLQFNILVSLTASSFRALLPSSAFDLLETLVSVSTDVPLSGAYYHIFYLMLRGRLNDAGRAIEKFGQDAIPELAGMLAMMRGDDDGAIALFDKGIARIKKNSGKRKVFYASTAGLFYLLSLVRSARHDHLKIAVELSEIALKHQEHPQHHIFWLLNRFAELRLGNNRQKKELEDACRKEYELDPLSHLVRSLIALWLKLPVMALHSKILDRISDDAKLSGFLWIAAEAALLSKAINPEGKHTTAWAEQLCSKERLVSLSLSTESGNDWERSLTALLSIGSSDISSKETVQKQSRLLWFLSGKETNLGIQPVEQKQTAKGWTGGRNAALKRLFEEGAKLDFLTPQDRKIIACIRKERGYGYYSTTTYEFDNISAIRAMIDHPLVFNYSHNDEPVTVSKGTFTLEVMRKKGNLTITLSPLPDNDGSPFLSWEGASRLLLYEPTTEQRRIAAIIGEGLTVPKAGEKQITSAITAISPHVTVHSDIVGDDTAGAETVEADSRLYILLRPSGDGVSVELRIRPFGEHGPTFPPSRGGATLIAQVQGKKLQCSRDQKREQKHLEMLLKICSTFDLYGCHDEQWRIDNPKGALELLEELHEAMIAAPDAFVMQWPEGERFKLRGSASWERLKLSVRSGKEWFSLEGEVPVSEDEVISLQCLMELMESGKGRFVQLAEGEFMALSDEFRRRLDDLRRVMNRHGKELRFHPLAAPLVDEALDGVGSLKGDKTWKSLLARFREAEALQPVLPATLQTELRDYQLAGFDWLSRLAHWGVGACLADDMGLGKTIQALALLINRAPAGPSLVLAPTSVCLNWESETHRFAPTLQPRIFGSGNRKSFIESLQPFDLVICSYTMFQQEAELLNSVQWETAVLDEAQAIKNMTTKRSQAAMQINAGFRIATTGTPIENRLDELWNLFRFLNPGLLGSHKTFTERFATPIERDRDKPARTLLKKLIRPFILRRTKSQVLQELPPRTEILHRVELSGEEAAFYEALRRKALDNLSGGAEGQTPGERQIRILAEIMRLRRACCNPQLVLPECNISSAKLTAFREIVDELRDNGHRALVFSQFVDHLSILRKVLDMDNITYQYLDGSTPANERQARVNAFQSGQGELFLISLKAGGVGLNLTAADYVIHMDPWWNPAVEDQASDRAHRIGQLRPVTVYRLVAANTIEEKIVAMHGQKRDLADSLLEGTETAARVSADDLLELLREAREGIEVVAPNLIGIEF